MDSVRHDQFAKAFLLYQGRVYGQIVTMLPNRHDAEDVFQQTSLVLWQKWDQFDPEQDFLAWACGVARNEVRNFLRRHGRQRIVLSEKLLDELAEVRLKSESLLDQRRSLLVECMKKLDFIPRELIERCYKVGNPIQTIARQFRTTPNAIYLRLCRIRRQLLECIEQGVGREDSR